MKNSNLSFSNLFTFDGNNKQIFVTDGNNATVGEYAYDGNGQRVKKKRYVGGALAETVIFAYSGGKLVEEYSTVATQSPKTKYLTEDHLGTPRIITDQNGAVVSRRDFMPFGEDLSNGVGARDSAMNYGSNDDDVRQKFTGYQKDTETGLDFAEARMYENKHARFTAVDPLLASGNSVNPQTFNRYVYVVNNPIFFTDPSGLCPTQKVDGTVIPCPENYDGVVYTNGERYNDEKPDDTWSVFTGQVELIKDGIPTVVTGTYTNAGLYYGGWYSVSDDDINVDASEVSMTDTDVFLEGFRRVGEPALPILEIIQPTPLPAFGVIGGLFKIARGVDRANDVRQTLSISKSLTKIDNLAEATTTATTSSNFWSKPTTFNGTRVYQRTDVFDPQTISSWKVNGKTVTGTNVERMAAGKSPIGIDGKSVNLHHMLQTNTSPLAEMTQTFHKTNHRIIHINPSTIPSGINRTEFNTFRFDYWVKRANDFK